LILQEVSGKVEIRRFELLASAVRLQRSTN
jgi:hypothetical protein